MTLKQEAIRLLFAICSLMLVVMLTGTNLNISTSVTVVETPTTTIFPMTILPISSTKKVLLISKQQKKPLSSKTTKFKISNNKFRKIAGTHIKQVKKDFIENEINKSDSLLAPTKSISKISNKENKENKNVTATLKKLIKQTDMKTRLSVFFL